MPQFVLIVMYFQVYLACYHRVSWKSSRALFNVEDFLGVMEWNDFIDELANNGKYLCAIFRRYTSELDCNCKN